MGSDFSFIIVAREENRYNMENFINNYVDSCVSLDSAKVLGMALNFPIDSLF